MNVPFCAFVRALRDEEVWVLFHEVAVSWGALRQWRQNTIATANAWMVRLLVARADRIFVTVPAWDGRLRRIAPACPPTTWLPVPSNVPLAVPEAEVRRVRERIGAAPDAAVVGHFGHQRYTAAAVATAMRRLLLRDERRVALLVGRGGEAIARQVVTQGAGGAARDDARLKDRVVATGGLELADIAAHLAACDVLVQPYADGVSGRRTSLMAGLALGVPIVTNSGPQTEPLWRESRAVEIVDADDDLAAVAEALLGDRERSAALARRGVALYDERFSLDRTIDLLRNAAKDKTTRPLTPMPSGDPFPETPCRP